MKKKFYKYFRGTYIKNLISVIIICLFIGFAFGVSTTQIHDDVVPLNGGDPNIEPIVDPNTDPNVEPNVNPNTDPDTDPNTTPVIEPDNGSEDDNNSSENGNGTSGENGSGNKDNGEENGTKPEKNDNKECEHEWYYTSNKDGTHIKECSKCGDKETESCTIDDGGKCPLCGYEEQEKCEHEWTYVTNNDGTHTKTCVICGDKEIEDCTFEKDAICTLCGYIDPERCTHEWTYISNGEGTHTKTCSKCHTEEIETCTLDKDGMCAFCGYIEQKTVYDNISELKTAKLSEGQVVRTLGYYSNGDGGEGEYTITKYAKIYPNDGTCIKLTNGLYALLNNPELANIKQFGARGDGSTDDSAALKKMLDLKYDIVRFNGGRYAFNNALISLNKKVTLEGTNGATLINVGFAAPYGIIAKNLNFNGGAKTTFYDVEGAKYGGPINFLIRPVNSSCSVEYNSCTFKNVQFVSFMFGTQTIASDSAINCTFTNIARVALYHSMNINSSTYTGNTFTNIGKSNILYGPVSAIWLGDVTNNTQTESKNALIEGNTFRDLYTGDDPNDTSHNLNANFICVRARRATINKNNISEVHGYGQDRECVYTKVCYLNVTNNIITNGGFGEGYITCKGQNGLDAFAVISGNTITGDYGSGIYLYGAGQIKNNKISIANCRIAIVTHVRDCATRKNLSVSYNTIKCNPGNLYINGKKMEKHVPDALISIDAGQCDTFLQGNTIYTESSEKLLKKIIQISNVAYNLTITNNNITARIPPVNAIIVSSRDTYWSSNKYSTFTFSNNKIEVPDLALQVIYNNPSGATSSRHFVVENNKLNGSSTARYGIYICTNGGISKDQLSYKTEQEERNYMSNHVYTNMDSITTTSKFVTKAKK